jgi:hypothetical protein
VLEEGVLGFKARHELMEILPSKIMTYNALTYFYGKEWPSRASLDTSWRERLSRLEETE